MSETTARTLAEIVAEGRMLEETVQLAIDLRMPTFADELISRRNEFRAEHWPALLAVAEAAVRYTDALDDYDNTDDGDFVQQRALLTQTEVALRAAVRGEEKTS